MSVLPNTLFNRAGYALRVWVASYFERQLCRILDVRNGVR